MAYLSWKCAPNTPLWGQMVYEMIVKISELLSGKVAKLTDGERAKRNLKQLLI